MKKNENTLTEMDGSQSELHTPDWLRSFKGCEHYNDNEASEIISSLNVLAQVLLTGGDQKADAATTATIIPLEDYNLKKKAA